MSRDTLHLMLVLLCVACAACTATDEPDWPASLGDDPPIHQFTFVPLETRDAVPVDIVEDGVIREDSIPEPLSGSLDAAVGPEGEIVVLDQRAGRVHVLGGDGTFLRSFGAQGQGPGELTRPTSIAATAQWFVVYDHASNEFKVWSFDGQYVGSYRVFPRPVTLTQMVGADEGSLIVTYLNLEADGSTSRIVSAVRLGEGTFEELLRLPYLTGVVREGRTVVRRDLEASARQPLVAVDSGDSAQIYIVSRAAYKIAAFAFTGAPVWGVSVPTPHVPYPQRRKAEDSRRVQIFYRELSEDAVDFPEHLPPLAPPTLLVDGHGHLYVFLESGTLGEHIRENSGVDVRHVDVYSTLGRRIFSGSVRGSSWDTARGDYAYRRGRVGENFVVRRFRIHEPF